MRRNLLRRPPRRLALMGFGLAAAITLAACVPASPPPPPGQYVGLGFDTCSAPSVGTMDAWTSSPYHSIGIYIGGANAACPPQSDGLSASWVSQVTSVGWRLAPLYVGLQSPCNGSFAEMSPYAGTAYVQGAQAANSAVQDASVLGLGPGTPIYYDMESYNCGGYGSVGTTAVMYFVKAWVLQIHADGYVAGYYSSAATGIADQVTNVNQGEFYNPVPDDIWFADWNNVVSATNNPYIPNSYWVNQRLHQYEGGHNESYGGATLNIDLNYDDGSLAG